MSQTLFAFAICRNLNDFVNHDLLKFDFPRTNGPRIPACQLRPLPRAGRRRQRPVRCRLLGERRGIAAPRGSGSSGVRHCGCEIAVPGPTRGVTFVASHDAARPRANAPPRFVTTGPSGNRRRASLDRQTHKSHTDFRRFSIIPNRHEERLEKPEGAQRQSASMERPLLNRPPILHPPCVLTTYCPQQHPLKEAHGTRYSAAPILLNRLSKCVRTSCTSRLEHRRC